MPRSTLRAAAFAGALYLTATTAPAASADVHPPAHASKVGVSTKRMNVRIGSRVTVAGRVRAPGRVTVSLQVRRGWHWATLDRVRIDVAGRYVLRDRVRRTMSTRARVRISDGTTRALGRLNVYRYAYASWYGPGLYGNRLGCGGTLTAGSLGVAHKSLPCGAKITLRKGGHVVRVSVIDRGPYVAGREFDLTAATAQMLGFSGHGPIQVAD
jgi:rare lipoprotein A (peptidoglycan hydrolase)